MIWEKKLSICNLPDDINIEEILSLFAKFGKINWVKLENNELGRVLVTIEFQHKNDAEDALKAKDGFEIRGHRMQLELQ